MEKEREDSSRGQTRREFIGSSALSMAALLAGFPTALTEENLALGAAREDQQPLRFYRPLSLSTESTLTERIRNLDKNTQSAILKNASHLHKSTYPTDQLLVKSIQAWCRHAVLAGVPYAFQVEDCAIYQLASQSPYRQKYGVHISDTKLLKEILVRAKHVAATLKDFDLKSYDPAYGTLLLTRHVLHVPEARPDHGLEKPDPNRFVVVDVYRLDVFATKAPPLSVQASEVGPFFVYSHDRTLDAARAYFPQATDLVVSWHELARMLGVANTRLYLAACFAASNFQRPVTADIPNVVATPIFVPAGFPYGYEDGILGLVPGRDKGIDFTQVQPHDKFAVSMMAVASAFIRPIPYDGRIIPISDDVAWTDLASYENKPHELRFRWSWSDLPAGLASIPTPLLPANSPIETAVVQFLQEKSRGTAAYARGGLFVVEAPGLTGLAAGSGNWGPGWVGESLAVVCQLGGASGQAAAGGAAAAATGAVILTKGFGDLGDAHRTRDLLGDECATKPTTSECLQCYASVSGDLKAAKTAGIDAGVSGLVGIAGGVATVCLATGPVGWIIGGIIAVVGITVVTLGAILATDANRDVDSLNFDCDRRPI